MATNGADGLSPTQSPSFLFSQNAIRVPSVGSIILRDKEKPEVTRHLNDTYVTDICELGGDLATMRDVQRRASRRQRRRRRCGMTTMAQHPRLPIH